MKKLREIESGFGSSLGRVVDFTDENADALLAAQEAGALPKCWEPGGKSDDLNEPEGNVQPVDVVTVEGKADEPKAAKSGK